MNPRSLRRPKMCALQERHTFLPVALATHFGRLHSLWGSSAGRDRRTVYLVASSLRFCSRGRGGVSVVAPGDLALPTNVGRGNRGLPLPVSRKEVRT